MEEVQTHTTPAQETDTKQNSEVKMAEIVEDIKDNREDQKELVRLMYDLFYNNGGPWYR